MPHQHSPTSTWSRKRQLRARLRDELKFLIDNAFRDNERGEVVSLFDSDLLTVMRGEILRGWSGRYQRQFQVLNQR